MTPSELYTLIQSDTEAKAAYDVSNDVVCAARCGVIAPTVRTPVPAEDVQFYTTAAGFWGAIKRVAQNPNASEPPQIAAISFIDWITSGRSLNFDSPNVQALAAQLVTAGLVTQQHIDQLSALMDVPQKFTPADIGAAREAHGSGVI